MQTRILSYFHTAGELLRPHLGPAMVPKYPLYCAVSRCQHQVQPFNTLLTCETIADISSRPNHRLTLSELIDRRALDLLSLPERIFVLWSGGIDSSTVITSILKNWSPGDLSKVTVLCNNSGIKENPNFFKIIANNFKVEFGHSKLEDFLKQGFVVTGEPGDQIFGSDMWLEIIKRGGANLLWEPWDKVGLDFFTSLDSEKGKATFENYAQLVKESPIEIQTARDFFWWIDFTQKWQHVIYRVMMANVWNDPKTYFPKMVHFYNTVDFQIWSLHNHDKKIKNDWASYKYLSKEYVIEYTKDVSFLNKSKIASLQNLYLGNKINFAIDEQWNFLNFDECIERLRS